MPTRRQLLQGAAVLALLGSHLPLRAAAAAQALLLPNGIGCSEPDGQFPRLVRHYRGELKLPAQPERMAVLATGELDAALTLGVVPRASTTNGFAQTVPGYLLTAFPQYRAALEQIVALGKRTEPDLLAMGTLRPDLILGTNAGAHGLIYEQLQALGPTVLAGGDGANWQQDFLFLGEVLGARQRAVEVIAAYTQRCAALRQRLNQSGRTPRISFARFGPNGLDVYGTHSFVGVIASDLGLTRPTSQRFAKTLLPLPAERVGELDGDWLFFSEIDYPVAQKAKEKAQPGWENLAVVRAGRAIRVDAEAWHANAGPTAANLVLDDLQAHLLG